MEKNRILAAVDRSEWLNHIVEYMGKAFSPKNSEITLFHVANPIPEILWDFHKDPLLHFSMKEAESYFKTYKMDTEKRINEARKRLIDLGFPEDSVKVKIEERKIGIARDIIAEVQKGYDILIVGRRGESKLKELILGTIAMKIIGRLSKMPIAVVGERNEGRDILIAIDLSPQAIDLARSVGKMFQESGCKIHVIHVLREIEKTISFVDAWESTIPKWYWDTLKEERERALEEAKNAINKVKEILSSYGLQVEAEIIHGAYSRAEEIVKNAQKKDCHTVVLGRRGISRVEEFFMGRVSTKVLQLAKNKTVWIMSD